MMQAIIRFPLKEEALFGLKSDEYQNEIMPDRFGHRVRQLWRPLWTLYVTAALTAQHQAGHQ